jgi:hypothetical protein
MTPEGTDEDLSLVISPEDFSTTTQMGDDTDTDTEEEKENV